MTAAPTVISIVPHNSGNTPNELGLSSGASTGLVDRLERSGVAERYPHPHDRRRTLVRLTSRGHEVIQLSHQWLSAGFRSIDPADHDVLAANLRSISEDLSTRSGEIAAQGPASSDALG